MSKLFWRSAEYKIIKAMKATGNRDGIVQLWKEYISAWAEMNPCNPDAVAIQTWLPHWQVRPFYTSPELAPLFPMIAVALGISDRPGLQKGPRRLQYELDYGGLPMLNNGTLFRHPGTGVWSQYYVVERLHFWRGRNVTQAEFEREFLCG